MDYTGERYIPSNDCYSIMAEEHWHRYFFAQNYVYDKIVLDIACGEGYGTNLLSQYAKKVYGRDVSSETINWAKNKYKNVDFAVMDIAKIDFLEDSFDVITCFETIEHVDSNIQQKALLSFSKILKNDGVLLISTPNVDTELHAKNNNFHEHEYSYKEFSEELNKHFKYVKILGQTVYCCSVIGACDKQDFDILNKTNFTDNNKYNINNDKYYIAICSNSSINHDLAKDSIMIDRSLASFKQLMHVRRCISRFIPIYNAFILFICLFVPIKSWKEKLKSLVW